MDYTNKSLGLRVQTQIPLNVKEYAISEEDLKDLGPGNNLAYIYEKGLIIYCILEGTRYEWKEYESEDITLLDTNFTYPDNIIAFGIDYSNKEYNFAKVLFGSGTPPLQRIDQGVGEGIIIRGRDNSYYGPVGQDAIDLSHSVTNDGINGATGTFSSAIGLNALSSGYASIAVGSSTAVAQNSVAIGFLSEAFGPQSIAMSGGQANGMTSFTNGVRCFSNGDNSNTEGGDNEANGIYSKALNRFNISNGYYSFSGGYNNESNSFGEFTIGHYGTILSGSASDFTIVPTDRIFNIGIGTAIDTRKDAINVFKTGVVTLPTITNALITAGSGKTIVTKEYLEKSYQKLLVYPSDFIGINYTLLNTDKDKLFFIDNGSTNVTITVPIGLPDEFFAAFIQEGTGDVSFVQSGTIISSAVGLKIKEQYNQVALDKKGATTTFFLTGNTKI